MLSKVSWGEFLSGAGVMLVIYYLVIGAGYFRKDIVSFLSKIQKKGDSAKDDLKGNRDESANALTSIEELEQVVTDVHVILEKAGNPASKDEVLRQIGQRLNGYAGLRIPSYRVALNNYIMQHASDVCDVTFSEQELNKTWDALSR